jgi:uncharacterized protein YqeY
MMSLVKQVNDDFVVAFKEKNTIGKMALGNLKSKLSDAEKIKKSELTDDEALKVIVSIAKTRNQSIQEFTKAGRMDLVESEKSELDVIEKYLPKQMTEDEIETEVRILISEMDGVKILNLGSSNLSNNQVIIGRTLGFFNKKFQGRADVQLVKKIIEKIVG